MSLASNRSGKVKVSTVVILLLIAAAVYYGMAFGGVYWRRYDLSDTIDQQLSYAGQVADENIRAQIVQEIGSMNLPPAASRIRFARVAARTIEVTVSYTETVNLLFDTKDIPVSVTKRRSW